MVTEVRNGVVARTVQSVGFTFTAEGSEDVSVGVEAPVSEPAPEFFAWEALTEGRSAQSQGFPITWSSEGRPVLATAQAIRSRKLVPPVQLESLLQAAAARRYAKTDDLEEWASRLADEAASADS